MTECEHGDDPNTCPPCQRVPGYDAGPAVADCRSCGRPIVWTVTTRGKRMPVDAEPDPQGSIALRFESEDGGPPRSYMVKGDARRAEAEAGALHTSHFATCPQSSEWRRS